MTSAQLGIAYMGYKVSDTKFIGLILTPEFRIYPKKNAINGFYIAPYFRYHEFICKKYFRRCKCIFDCNWRRSSFWKAVDLQNRVLIWICFLEGIMEVDLLRANSGMYNLV